MVVWVGAGALVALVMLVMVWAAARQLGIAVRLRDRLFYLLWEADFEPMEALLALRTVAWGFWLLLPWETFQMAPVTYGAFGTLAPEPVWGAVALLVGLFQVAASLADSGRLRAPASVAAAMLWHLIAAMYFVSNTQTVAGISHLLTAMGAGWVALRVWVACLNQAKTPRPSLSSRFS
jgi:hypothetical protein